MQSDAQHKNAQTHLYGPRTLNWQMHAHKQKQLKARLDAVRVHFALRYRVGLAILFL